MEKITPLTRLWNQIRLDKSEIVSIYFYAGLSGLIQLSLPVGIQAIIGFVLGASMVTSIYVLIRGRYSSCWSTPNQSDENY